MWRFMPCHEKTQLLVKFPFFAEALLCIHAKVNTSNAFQSNRPSLEGEFNLTVYLIQYVMHIRFLAQKKMFKYC